MRFENLGAAALLTVATLTVLVPVATNAGSRSTAESVASRPESSDSQALRLEGERRFKANCARCHAYPPKFPPRMMTTIVRHMRVRATITDEDMRLILRYMTE